MLNIHPDDLNTLKHFARNWHEGGVMGESPLAKRQKGDHREGGGSSGSSSHRLPHFMGEEWTDRVDFLFRLWRAMPPTSPELRDLQLRWAARKLQVTFGSDDHVGLGYQEGRKAEPAGWDVLPCGRCKPCRKHKDELKRQKKQCLRPGREQREAKPAIPARTGYGSYPRAVLVSEAAIREYDAHHIRPLYAFDELRSVNSWKPDLQRWLIEVDEKGTAGDTKWNHVRNRITVQTELEIKRLLLAMGMEVNGETKEAIPDTGVTVSQREIAAALSMRREDVARQLDKLKIRTGRRRKPGKASLIPLDVLRMVWPEAWRALSEPSPVSPSEPGPLPANEPRRSFGFTPNRQYAREGADLTLVETEDGPDAAAS